MKKTFNLQKDAATRGVLLVAHRGVWGGNIPPNTIGAYETALAHGADMIEVDLNMTSDGRLVIFHPQMERALLGWNGRVSEHPWSFVKQLRYQNIDDAPTPYGLCTFDEVLERFKGRCYLNIDKFWNHPAEIAAAIRDHGMADQCVVKTGLNTQVLSIMEEYAADMPFLAIVSNEKDLRVIRRRKLRHVGVEALFDNLESPFATREWIERQHKAGQVCWANAIIYDYKAQLVAGRSDDMATAGNDPEGSWGWLADLGYDLIQTDWLLACGHFLERTGRRRPLCSPCGIMDCTNK